MIKGRLREKFLPKKSKKSTRRTSADFKTFIRNFFAQHPQSSIY